MRTYEIVVIVKAGSDADRKKVMDFVKGLLKGTKIVKEEDLGSKALAYPIQHELTGHYYDLVVEGELVPADFEKRMMENTEVLRQLVLKK